MKGQIIDMIKGAKWLLLGVIAIVIILFFIFGQRPPQAKIPTNTANTVNTVKSIPTNALAQLANLTSCMEYNYPALTSLRWNSTFISNLKGVCSYSQFKSSDLCVIMYTCENVEAGNNG